MRRFAHFVLFTTRSIGKPIDLRIDMRSGCNVVVAAPLVVWTISPLLASKRSGFETRTRSYSRRELRVRSVAAHF